MPPEGLKPITRAPLSRRWNLWHRNTPVRNTPPSPGSGRAPCGLGRPALQAAARTDEHFSRAAGGPQRRSSRGLPMMTTTPRTPRPTLDPRRSKRRSSQEPQRLVTTRSRRDQTPELPIETNPSDSTRTPKRMGWDLNPRTTFAVAGFQGRRRGSAPPRRTALERRSKRD
jgi:hypothetical protein